MADCEEQLDVAVTRTFGIQRFYTQAKDEKQTHTHGNIHNLVVLQHEHDEERSLCMRPPAAIDVMMHLDIAFDVLRYEIEQVNEYYMK